ncbi:cold-regulated 413 plasma membrane protein 1-like [Mangifera indica]|uniref:cold-regulated 413 plasma membrane protein 1-like n=1 Tax=Mangifera indica TaxID=29780 RepID=UPI001CFA6CCF|nr:cold-regulated 413 plasma membrane protein 1-like [Mangifera indica]
MVWGWTAAGLVDGIDLVGLGKEKEVNIQRKKGKEIMGKKSGYLAMRSEQVTRDLMSSDMKELVVAAKKLAIHAIKLGGFLGFGTSILEWVASFAAIYLLVLDRTHWRTKILTALLIPYIFFSLPSLIFEILRGEVSKWISFIITVLRLFFPSHFPAWLEMPGALLLLIVVAPSLVASTLKYSWVGVAICLIIACYLLQQHIRVSGGFRNSFTRANGILNSAGIIILLIYPVWALIADFV